jgi:hypothetical protein
MLLKAEESASRTLFVLRYAFHIQQAHRVYFSAREMASAGQLAPARACIHVLAQMVQMHIDH